MEELMALLQGGGMSGGEGPEAPPAMPSQQPGIPPQLAMILQALEGIGAQAAMRQGSGQGKMNAMAQEQFVPPDTGMPMEGGRQPPMDDQAMLDQVHDKMGKEEHEWEGEEGGTPTEADLKAVEANPDLRASFDAHFGKEEEGETDEASEYE